MLKSLHIENLALLESTDIYFDKGLSVLTGETGAGKSVIVNAISLVLGGRSDREHIRFRADKAIVMAVFNVSLFPVEYKNKYKEFINIDELIIFREITRTGKSTIKINNINSTLAELKEITAPIAEILGQHANQMLMNEDYHLEFLDNFASLHNIKSRVAELFLTWKDISDELAKTIKKRDVIINERELLLFQKKEIEDARIESGEEERLINSKKILDSSRELIRSANLFKDLLDNEEQSAMNLLSLAQKELDKMTGIDSSLEKQSEELTDLVYRLNDLSLSVEQYGRTIDDDPHKLEEINQRLDEIYNLKKKYGGSEDSILSSLVKINEKLSQTPPDIDDFILKLEQKKKNLFDEYSKDAISLSETRKKAASYLQKLVVKELSELAIENGGFEFDFIYEGDPNGVLLEGKAVKPTPNGLESGKIMFSANPGEPLKSLVKTASGGEISRVLLALKSAEKKNLSLGKALMVFDEVDAGIGGKTALEVAKKIKRLSQDCQVLVITHLHQIAREADHHYLAEKVPSKNKRTTITVKRLEDSEISAELSRMVAIPE